MTRTRDERGSVSLEMSLLLPAVIVTLVAVIQVALAAHAGHVTDAAAREGARTARLSGDIEAGRAEALELLEQHGAVVSDPTVEVTTSRGTVTVAVTGRAATLLPGFRVGVTGRSSGTIEEFHVTGQAIP